MNEKKLKMFDKVKVWNGGTAEKKPWWEMFAGHVGPERNQREGDEWIFIAEIPIEFIASIPDPSKRQLCLHTKAHSGARVIGNPVFWRFVQKVESDEK